MDINNTENSYEYGKYLTSGNEGNMWNYGFEAWCNLQGQYVTLLADLTNVSD